MARVSVLIAARNRRQFLPSCIDSVRKQTYHDHEIILIDDGSTDGTRDLKNLVDVYRETPPQGVGHARNLAMRLARGEYLYVLDSDDLLTPDALTLSVETIASTAADMVFSELLLMLDGHIFGTADTREQTLAEALVKKDIPHGSSMIRRSTLNVEYDETLASAEDYDFLLRYIPGKTIRKLPKPVYIYRWHQGQEGWNPMQQKTAEEIRTRYK